MKVTCRLKQYNKPTTIEILEFTVLPRKGDLINPDEHGNGIHGYVEEVIWIHGEEGYYPRLVIKAHGKDQYKSMGHTT